MRKISLSRSVFDGLAASIKTSASVNNNAIPAELWDQTLIGDNKVNTLLGTLAKNVFFGAGGNDKIIGDSHTTNTAVYSNSIDKYKITTTSDGITVKALNGNEGTDTLVNVSQLIFNGVTYTVQPTTVGHPATLTVLPASSPSDPIPTDPIPPSDTSSTPTSGDQTASDSGSTSGSTDSGSTGGTTGSDGGLSNSGGSAVLVSPPPSDITTSPPPSDTSTNPPPSDTTTTPPPSDPATTPPPVTSTGDLPTFSLQNTSGSPEGTGYVTFGQVFAKGAVMPGDTLIAKVNGQDVAVQMDVKTTNADGSVAHAILTLKAPAIGTDSSVTGMLAKAASPASPGPAIQAQDILSHGYNFKVDVTLHNADGSTTVKTIDAAQLLQQAINGGNVETWMKGAQTSEYRVEGNIAPNLDVKFDIRMDADGKTHTDVIFARDEAYSTSTDTITYDVKFTQDGQTAFSESNIQQFAFSTWHHEVNSAGSIDPHVVYDVAYLIKTGAIPAYDLSTGVSDATIANYSQQLAQSDTDPLGNALVQKWMPMTGGRADIGPESTWTATYLISQNADAAKVMYANADAAGSVPWHVIDTNGDAIRVDLHPDLWLDYRAYGANALPNGYHIDPNGFTPDVAHQPSLTYVPYLLSGTHYYLDELQAQASYTIASVDPGYRGGDDGILSELVTQIRALSWGLRDISNAAYITPDGDAMKGYFTTILNNNLDYLINNFVNGAKGAAEGQAEGWIGVVGGDLAPWQQDYLTISLQYLADKGFTKADTILDWMDNFVSGRFINEANGFDPLHGATYFLKVTDPATGQLYDTWQEVYQATFGTGPTTMDGAAYPDWAGGYAANAKASLASMITATQSPDAIEAYGWLQSQTTAMKASYYNDPTWNIAPKLANGEYLTNNEIFVSSNTAGDTMTAGNGEAMLIGNVGNDTLVGGSGIAMLFGMDGNDTLKAGSGNSYLYGGDGNDRLEDGSGANYFKGGAGADVFSFTTASTGHDTIADFTKGSDRIEIKSNLNGNGITTAAQVVANATADADGNAVLHLGPQHDIVLQGVMLHQLTSDIFTIV